uniref:IS3 family transposase n=1 Tax=Brevibacillus agri TaxID=51101 RepID=UPI00399D0B1C
YLEKFKTREQAKRAIFEYITCFYNGKRIHFHWVLHAQSIRTYVPMCGVILSILCVQSIDSGSQQMTGV